MKSKSEMIVGFFLSSVATIVPVSIWYNISGMFVLVIIYLMLGITVFLLVNKNRETIESKN